MGSRQADSLALVNRCKKAGWRVKKTNDGYKIFDDTDGIHVVHMTYSDGHRSLRNITQKLERSGLKDAEANMANLKFSHARDTTTRERTAAEKRAATMAEKAATASRVAAAGPYLTEPEDVGIVWFADKHPAPWQRWVNITPEIADYLLTHHNTLNRPLNQQQVEHYKKIILSGQWHLTHQGIAMDTEAVLQDGQHRLHAVIEAATQMDDATLKVPFAFFVGMPTENFKAIDEGLLRTAAQLFSRSGEKNGATLQTAIRLVVAYKDPNAQYGFRIKMPNEAIVDAFAEDPDEFRNAANHAQSHYKKYHSSSGAVAAVRYLLRRANGADNKYVVAFLEGLMTGRKAGTRLVLDDADPRAVYRELMIKTKLEKGRGAKRISSRDQVAMMLMSWNNLVNNYTPRYLKFTDDTPIPRIVVCRDTGNNASSCPALLVGEIAGDEDDE